MTPRSPISRRLFVLSAATALTGTGFGQEQGLTKTRQRSALDLSTLPNFCAHEHWGSIDSIGMVPEGFRADVERGATPNRRTGLFDILLDPYFKGWLTSGGTKLDDIARQAGHNELKLLIEQSPSEALRLLRPSLARHQLIGVYQCIRRGILALYGVDISQTDSFALSRLESQLYINYAHIFEWYRNTMKKVRFSELVRPVHPEFYVREESPERAAMESAFTRTVMRIDPLLELWPKESERRNRLAKITEIEPRDASSWRAFIARIFNLAAGKGAVGIKQLQAYSRSLEYVQRKDSEVEWRGDLVPEQVRVFQDWVMHECCKQANDRGWAHQVHVGTHNLTQSSPMPLRALARNYSRMKIVMIHCWPFLAEAGWLAKHHPNVYIDTCWQSILNPAFFREAMTGWLNYVPIHKITCSHDATSIEMAVGSWLFTHEILAEALIQQSRSLGITQRDLRRAAADMLHNNAVAIYGIGKTVSPDGSKPE